MQYIYTDLDKIRADMLKVSTINARQMANQFAKDSIQQFEESFLQHSDSLRLVISSQKKAMDIRKIFE